VGLADTPSAIHKLHRWQSKHAKKLQTREVSGAGEHDSTKDQVAAGASQGECPAWPLLSANCSSRGEHPKDSCLPTKTSSRRISGF
jgi:hypothetical protein